jgi:oxygen-independent coproporphyrinogen-3 oxidase
MHNVRYWQRRPYLGLGPGAASNICDLRWTEPESVPDWIGGAGAADVQRLDLGEILAETALLGLRMSEGVNWAVLRETAETQGLGGLVRGWEEELAPLVALGVLERDGDQLRLTPKGTTLANQAFRVFV